MSFRLNCYKMLWFDSYCSNTDTLQIDMCQTIFSVWQFFDDMQYMWQCFEDTQCNFLMTCNVQCFEDPDKRWQLVDVRRCLERRSLWSQIMRKNWYQPVCHKVGSVWQLVDDIRCTWQKMTMSLMSGGVWKEDHRHGWRLRWRLAPFWQGRKRKVIW